MLKNFLVDKALSMTFSSVEKRRIVCPPFFIAYNAMWTSHQCRFSLKVKENCDNLPKSWALVTLNLFQNPQGLIEILRLVGLLISLSQYIVIWESFRELVPFDVISKQIWSRYLFSISNYGGNRADSTFTDGFTSIYVELLRVVLPC